MALTVFWACCALLIYSYVLYPMLVAILAKRIGMPVVGDDALRRTTIIVTVYNEADCIRAKLDNLAGLEYPRDLIQILVVSDGSSDATEEIAAGYELRPVRVLRVDGRKGKTACQNAAALVADGEILVFTDATTRLQADAIRAMASKFADPQVGCVGGRLEYVSNVENMTGSGGEAYWSYETRLRIGESSLGSLIGVSGCLYAVRKSAYRPIDPGLISDFAIAMKMQEQGLRTVLAPDACCYEATLENGTRELSMRVRVGVRSLNALVRERRFLNPVKHGRFAWQLWSHKVFRYASPFLWIGALTANMVLINYHVAYLIMFVAQCSIIAAGVAGFILQDRRHNLGLLAKPYYFLLTNLASLIAALRYLRGERMVVWTPVR
ncbi:MAG TPA: glycosyltransferase family 2 protein [Rhizomicrobium sp.]|jgi:cellulose synthase/poly-beta-1,6-N-acetylglucosamine synthase-like glycosyltransferase|nr:glycosyltransferase family 2 protein [Rhizomicrobium sp.]